MKIVLKILKDTFEEKYAVTLALNKTTCASCLKM